MKSSEEAIKEQLIHYNNRDLHHFSDLFHDDVKAYSLPDTQNPTLQGKTQLTTRYRDRFSNSPDLHSHLKERMVLGNFVVDDEEIKGMEEDIVRIIAIYEVIEGLITRMWFIRGEEHTNVIEPVEGQLDGYNSRNIEKFMKNYSEDCQMYNLSTGEILMQGSSAMKERYGTLFDSSPNLKAKVVQRMFLGEFVIDYENVSGFKDSLDEVKVIAVNHVQNQLITAVWFARPELDVSL